MFHNEAKQLKCFTMKWNDYNVLQWSEKIEMFYNEANEKRRDWFESSLYWMLMVFIFISNLNFYLFLKLPI